MLGIAFRLCCLPYWGCSKIESLPQKEYTFPETPPRIEGSKETQLRSAASWRSMRLRSAALPKANTSTASLIGRGCYEHPPAFAWSHALRRILRNSHIRLKFDVCNPFLQLHWSIHENCQYKQYPRCHKGQQNGWMIEHKHQQLLSDWGTHGGIACVWSLITRATLSPFKPSSTFAFTMVWSAMRWLPKLSVSIRDSPPFLRACGANIFARWHTLQKGFLG